jgi:hypothetical protein
VPREERTSGVIALRQQRTTSEGIFSHPGGGDTVISIAVVRCSCCVTGIEEQQRKSFRVNCLNKFGTRTCDEILSRSVVFTVNPNIM